MKKKILSINGEEPINYIQNFSGNFRNLKSPQGTFLKNIKIFNMIPISNYPFEKDKLTNIKIIYENGNSITIDFKVLHNKEKNKILNQYFDLPIPGMENLSNFPILRPKHYIFDNFSDKKTRKLQSINWDFTFDNKILKCKVDSVNQVNVIFQSSFHVSDMKKSMKFFDNCFTSFDKNPYPIIVIENYNGGGYVALADYFNSYLNLNKQSILYGNYRYTNDIKSNIANVFHARKLDNCKTVKGNEIFDLGQKEDFYGIIEDGDKLIHKRTKIFDVFADKYDFYDFREKAKNIRKPNEIIVFTDGFSYSATSIFIKELQINGGAIIVGYDGNPKLKEFDSSQSPSPVISTKDLSKDSLSKEIENLGFSLNYPII